MKKIGFRRIVLILLLSFVFVSYSQSFRFLGDVKKQSVNFTLKNNLIIIPIDVNGIELNFIMDSGVNATVLFNLKPSDSLEFKNIQNITLKGLGAGDPIEGLLSEKNRMKIKDIISPNQDFYIIFDDKFDLSSKLGLTIHGIIGYQLLKDFIVDINYVSKRITFYKPLDFKYKKVRKWESFNLEFYNNKPYINTFVRLDTISKKIPVKLLIDSGGSDALWLFENDDNEIKSPNKYFIDFLGQGLSGSIYGKRSRIGAFYLGKYVLKGPTVAFPDEVSTLYARKFEQRNGSIGGKILKRFRVLFDYTNGRLLLKKNGSFKDNFTYNKSGIELQYNGKVLVEELSDVPLSIMDNGQMTSNKVRLSFNYEFNFKNSYQIAHIRKGSPAELAGLEEGDIVIKINDKYTFNYTLEELTHIFHDSSHKKIKLYIERDGINFLYQFELEDIF